MIVELTAEQRDTLLQLVDDALRELGPEIHHTRTSSYKEDLRDQRRILCSLRELLADVPLPGVFAAPAGTGLPNSRRVV